jgi:CRISPR-associated protein Cmr3
MTTHHLIVCPRDGLFCKDGRGWRTVENGRGHALRWPHPSTLLGSLRAAQGRAQEAAEGRRWPRQAWAAKTAGVQLGAVLTLARPLEAREWTLEHRRWPTPYDAVYVREGGAEVTSVCRLVPQERDVQRDVPTLGRDDDPAREALWRPRALQRGKPQPRPQWWPEAAFVPWLCGQELGSAPADRDPQVRLDVHLQIDPKNQAALESRLFSREIVETLVQEEDRTHPSSKHTVEWALAAKVELPGPQVASSVLLGGDRRLCGVVEAKASLFEPPAALLAAFDRTQSRGLRLVIVTPAAFAQGWVPDFLRREDNEYRGTLAGAELVLRAAFVPRPIDVAGWDMASNRPKPLSRMVTPGSVYLLERTDGRRVDGALAKALWLTAVGERRSEGFGLMVPGVWELGTSSKESGARC